MKKAGLTTSLDTNDDPDDKWEGGLQDALRYVDVFLPNEREAQKAAGVSDLETAVKKLAAQVPLVVVKLGRAGATAQRGTERFVSPALRVEAVDAVGAGDSFDAGFLHSTCVAQIWPLASPPGTWRAPFPRRGPEARKRSETQSTARNSSKNIGSTKACDSSVTSPAREIFLVTLVTPGIREVEL